jgi:hypothetical protein
VVIASQELTTGRVWRWEWDDRTNRHDWIKVAEIECVANPAVALSAYLHELPEGEPVSLYVLELADGRRSDRIRYPDPDPPRRSRGLGAR